MEKIIKVVCLTTSHHLLISQLEEVTPMDIGQPDCRLTHPYWIDTESDTLTLTPFLLNVSRDLDYMISSDKILTLAEPTPTLLEKYLDLIQE
tara:strand:- start:818 stop:1093 length:276 start_codon:yes stop_codon:yes gene_type:complete